MSQKTPKKNDTLLCTHGDCEELQQEDGEYCKYHQGTFIDHVYILPSYNRNIKIEVEDDQGNSFIIDRDYLTKYLCDLINSKGYTISKSNRQKYPRLIINS